MERFRAYSAGTKPAGRVNPGALEWLQQHGLSTEGLRSKSWDEFTASGTPKFDFIFTVCDNAAGKVCTVWLCKPIAGHCWIPDPAHMEGDDARRAAFSKPAEQLERRIRMFMQMPIEKLVQLTLRDKIVEIVLLKD